MYVTQYVNGRATKTSPYGENSVISLQPGWKSHKRMDYFGHYVRVQTDQNVVFKLCAIFGT